MNPSALLVLYDDTCGFCCRCADFLRAQDKLVPLTCVPRSKFPVSLSPITGEGQSDELVVLDREGHAWLGGDAFVMALWALTTFRPWALKAKHPALRGQARSLFHWLSSRRHEVSRRLALRPEVEISRVLKATADEVEARRCTEESCGLPPRQSGTFARHGEDDREEALDEGPRHPRAHAEGALRKEREAAPEGELGRRGGALDEERFWRVDRE